MARTALAFQGLSFMPAPRKPVDETQLGEDPPPHFQDMPIRPFPRLLSDDADAADESPSRLSRVESKGFEGIGVSSLESRKSFFSENLPDKSAGKTRFPPNRILHNRHAARMESMLQDH